jgi:hypothetical protein
MNLLNATAMAAGYTLGVDPSAREHVVVVVKGTFLIPDDGGVAELAPKDAQAPLVMSDTFTGAPGFSAPVHEAEFCLRKPRCDVLLTATAYAPHGRSAQRVKVGVKLGAWAKVFDVVGDRVWRRGGLGASTPEPFTAMPISYDNAFGGADNFNADPSRHRSYMLNPIGRGFHADLAPELVNETPLPNTEESDRPVTAPNGRYRPMAFGPVGRGWHPRLAFAGTYDQDWLDNVFPFLPADFDNRHFQAAPEDQQIEEPQGGEEVILLNLTPEGRRRFRLPVMEMPVAFFPRDGKPIHQRAMLDTVVIEPDAARLCLVWRASLPLRRNLFELSDILVGQMTRAWWRARQLGKTYYPGIGALARERALAARADA